MGSGERPQGPDSGPDAALDSGSIEDSDSSDWSDASARRRGNGGAGDIGRKSDEQSVDRPQRGPARAVVNVIAPVGDAAVAETPVWTDEPTGPVTEPAPTPDPAPDSAPDSAPDPAAAYTPAETSTDAPSVAPAAPTTPLPREDLPQMPGYAPPPIVLPPRPVPAAPAVGAASGATAATAATAVSADQSLPTAAPQDLPSAVPTPQTYASRVARSPRSWWGVLAQRWWIFLVVAIVFYAAAWGVGWVAQRVIPSDGLMNLLWQLPAAFSDEFVAPEIELPSWLAVPLAAAVIVLWQAVVSAAVLAPVVTVATDAADGEDRPLHALLGRSLGCFAMLAVVFFAFWLFVDVAGVVVAWGVGSTLDATSEMDSGLLLRAYEIAMQVVFAIVVATLALKALFIAVNIARGSPALDSGWRRRPRWVLAMAVAFVAAVWFGASVVGELIEIETFADGDLTAGYSLITQASLLRAVIFVCVYWFVVMVVFAAVAADLLNRPRLPRKNPAADAVARMAGVDQPVSSSGRANMPQRRQF